MVVCFESLQRISCQMLAVHYKGFTITSRTFRLRGSGRWTLDLLIGQRESLRAFSGPSTFSTEEGADAGCLVFAQRIIDGSVHGCPLGSLLEDAPPTQILPFRPGPPPHYH
jgi:hypothetical protein